MVFQFSSIQFVSRNSETDYRETDYRNRLSSRGKDEIIWWKCLPSYYRKHSHFCHQIWMTCTAIKSVERLTGRLKTINWFYSLSFTADPDLNKGPASLRCCLYKWSLHYSLPKMYSPFPNLERLDFADANIVDGSHPKIAILIRSGGYFEISTHR